MRTLAIDSSPSPYSEPAGMMTALAPASEVPLNSTALDQSRAPVKVLFVDHTAKMGGGEIALLNLLAHLDRTRVSPVVVLFSDGPLREKLEKAGVETHLLSLPKSVVDTRKDSLGASIFFRLGDVFSTLGLVLRLRSFMKQHGTQLVHTNSLKSDIIGGLAGRLAGLPVIWHVRDRIDADYLPPVVARIFRFLAGHVPTYVIANSRATLATLNLSSPRKDFIYSGLDHVVHDGIRTEAEGRPLLSGGQFPRIGLVGRIARWKGQHIFIQAAARVHQRFPIARFQIIGSALFGEDAYEREVRDLVHTLGLENVVEFTGHREDVGRAIADLDILVHASITGEPFGQVIIEGMAHGKPVVATAGGGVLEIVVDGVTGSLVPMGDADAMATAIASMLSQPERAREMGRAGRRRVFEHFTIEQSARKVQNIYELLLDPEHKSTVPSPA